MVVDMRDLYYQMKMLNEPLNYIFCKEHFSTFYIFLLGINRGLEM